MSAITGIGLKLVAYNSLMAWWGKGSCLQMMLSVVETSKINLGIPLWSHISL